jgi:hypothetical protein
MKMLKWYFETWWTIIARPIYFYTKLKEESWKEKSLTFLVITSWLLAAAMTLAIFLIQYLPIGATLVEGIKGFKLLIVLPVLLTLTLVFLGMTLLILGGVLVIGLGAAFYAVGFILHYTYILLGGKGSLNRMLQSSFYSSAVALAGLFPSLFALLTRYNLLDLSLFRVGYNLIYGLVGLFVYGLWAVAGRKVYSVPKWKAFTGALVPVIILLIFGIAFDKIALSKLETWIAPLR